MQIFLSSLNSSSMTTWAIMNTSTGKGLEGQMSKFPSRGRTFPTLTLLSFHICYLLCPSKPGKWVEPYFIEQETKAQRGYTTCLGHRDSWGVRKLEPSSPDSPCHWAAGTWWSRNPLSQSPVTSNLFSLLVLLDKFNPKRPWPPPSMKEGIKISNSFGQMIWCFEEPVN